MISVETSNQRKGIGIVAVIGLHLLPHLGGLFPFWLIATLDQLGRFSVPLFLVLSGYGIARKYKVPTYSQVFSQSLKLLPAFIGWSLLLSWWVRPGGVWSEQLFNWPFLPTLLAGKHDYHLYFVPVLLVCYWLSPWLLRRLRTHPRGVLVATGIGTLGLLGWVELLLFGSGYSALGYDQLIYTIPLVWIWYFVLGAWLANHRPPIIRWWQLVAVTALLLLEGFVSFTILENANQAFRFTRIGVLAYASVVCLWLLQVQVKQVLAKWLSMFGKASYQLYLSHTLLIRLGFSLGAGTISVTTGLGVGLSMIGCWLVSTLVTRQLSKKLSFNQQK